jgi:hypothetical protein
MAKSRIRRLLFARELLVQREVQLQDVDVRLAQDPEAAAARVLSHELPLLFERDSTCLRDSGGLEFGITRTDVRIETGCRCRDGIGGNGLFRREYQRRFRVVSRLSSRSKH